MFLPLNMATLSPIPKEDISKASGFSTSRANWAAASAWRS